MPTFEQMSVKKALASVDAANAEYEANSAATTARPMDWAELSTRIAPPRDWAIDNWLGMDYVTLLAGAGGTGKSLASQLLASSLALGLDYIGQPKQPRNCLMWMCEDDSDEIWRRQELIAAYFGVNLADFAGRLHIVPRVGLENTLRMKVMGTPSWTPQWGELQEQVCDYKAEVLFVDNVGQTCADEIDRHSVTSFVNGFVGIGKPAKLKTATVLLAHPGKAAGSEFSGSTAWEATVRMRWYFGTALPDQDKSEIVEDSMEDARYLCKRKTNYSAKDYRKFTYANGVLIPEDIDALPQIDMSLRAKHADGVVMRGLEQLTKMGKQPTDGSSSPEYLPKLIMEFKMNEGMQKKELTNAMRGLMVLGKLTRGVVGTYSNRVPRYGLKAAQ